MAIDTRDWWLSRLKRRTHYVERTPWRMSRTRIERRAGWRHLAAWIASVFGMAVALIILIKALIA